MSDRPLHPTETKITGATSRRIVLGALGVGLAGVAVAATQTWRSHALPDPTNPAVTLRDVEDHVTRRYGVSDMEASTLARHLADNAVIMFDVRSEEEFTRGHLPGALRLDPAETVSGFIDKHAHRLDGKPIVFYCSVGVRSSEMVARLSGAVGSRAPGGLYNLRGGLFRWVAERRALTAREGTGTLHPFNADWQMLLTRTLRAT